MNTNTDNSWLTDRQKTSWLLIGGLALVTAYVYLNTIVGTAEAWSSPMYNHGYLIPAFAAVLLYLRHEPFGEVTDGERWLGLAIVTVAMAIRISASYLVLLTVDRLSLIVCLFGIFVLVGGLRALRWAGPAVAFLVFMFPWPRYAVDNLLRPLQTMASISSVYALQTFGVEVFREGNRIELEHAPMNVAEQCSGLRMATIFIALSVAIALISAHRPWWERLVVVASSIGIAMIVNVVRITITGLLYNLNIKDEIVQQIFHNYPGLLMVPLALGLLFLEMHILSRLVIEDHSYSTTSGMGIGSTLT